MTDQIVILKDLDDLDAEFRVAAGTVVTRSGRPTHIPRAVMVTTPEGLDFPVWPGEYASVDELVKLHAFVKNFVEVQAAAWTRDEAATASGSVVLRAMAMGRTCVRKGLLDLLAGQGFTVEDA